MLRAMPRVGLLIVAWLALVACGAPGASSATPTPAAERQVLLASDDFAVGAPRVPLVLFDGPERIDDATAVAVSVFDISGDTSREVWSGAAENYSDFEVPYWVVHPTFPAAGNWGLGLIITLADGSVAQATAVARVSDDNASPSIGERPPASENRTLRTEPDLARLSSAVEPVPALYAMTVAEAMASGRPSVVTFSTPAFCATQICGPVVDSVAEVQAELGDEVNFLHLEIFKDFETMAVADEVEAWGLSSEPWTFILDGDGVVRARLGGPVSPRELRQALVGLTNAG